MLKPIYVKFDALHVCRCGKSLKMLYLSRSFDMSPGEGVQLLSALSLGIVPMKKTAIN